MAMIPIPVRQYESSPSLHNFSSRLLVSHFGDYSRDQNGSTMVRATHQSTKSDKIPRDRKTRSGVPSPNFRHLPLPNFEAAGTYKARSRADHQRVN
jgi:hypothetical protein